MIIPLRDAGKRLAAERPVIVMGRGHSGTRLLAWALNELGVHMGVQPAVATGDAQDLRFTRTIKRLAVRGVKRPGVEIPDDRDIRRFQRAAWRYMDWLGKTRPRWGWKFPETYLVGNLTDAVFPCAQYVHLVRDGRDVAFKTHLTDDTRHRLGRAILEHLGVADEPRHIQAAHSWEYQVRRFGDVETQLGDRVHRLTFEGLVDNPIHEMRRICEFLEVPFTEPCRDFLERTVERGKISQYLSESRSRIAEVESMIGGTLQALGYEVGTGP